MDRRAWGAVLVVVVIVAALTVPNLAGRRVEGTATRIPIADPPQVGDCLLDDPTGNRSVLDYTSVEIYAATTGPCGQENYGEVVSVTMDARSFPVTVANRLSHPEPMACNPLVRAYFGWPDGDIGRIDGSTADAWRPVAIASVGLIGPNLWQYLGRQNWLACVIYPRQGPYPGSIGRSLASRAAANAFALCLSDSGSESRQSTSCTVPHHTEILGWATVTDPQSEFAALNDSCREFAARVTALPDVTAGGRLSVGALVLHDDGQGGWSASPANTAASAGQVACALSADGTDRLTGTLVGIADGALPWA
jgi:hypothetical protein